MSQVSLNKDLLVEIHTEELPPKALLRLAESFLAEIKSRLEKLEFGYREAKLFATPRRLTILIKKLIAKQPDAVIARKGPALEAAFDKNNLPTPACMGFAKSCGVTPDQLTKIENSDGSWVGFQQTVLGKSIQQCLPDLVKQSLAALPIPKRMRWGSNTVEFVRPVHSVILLYGNDVVDSEIMGVRTGRLTRGHRFHSKGWVSISNPARYEKALERKFVVADFEKRKAFIRNAAMHALPEEVNGKVYIEENLLNEVTGLVEWPVAICGRFDKDFLEVPAEALIAAMQDHQRYFPVVDSDNKLLPYFVTISNIDSKDVTRVIAGNERVLRARLSDAAFFFTTDKKQTLHSRIENLKNSIFQAKLGTLYDKSQRIAELTRFIAEKMGVDSRKAERAGWLAKSDLTTSMVGEFPELQGVIGSYYAVHDGEDSLIARAINEQYMPRFSGDELPASSIGQALAIADRIDTLVGIFGIQLIPTGDKDPYGLRRAALGVLRILIQKKINLDLDELIQFSVRAYGDKLTLPNVGAQVFSFMLERLKPWYVDQGITPDVLASVTALNISQPYDIHLRIQAVQNFKNLPQADSLSVANKRVSNILAKSDSAIMAHTIDENLFEHDAERTLVSRLADKNATVSSFSEAGNYTEVLTQLADLSQPIDDFFEHVMVMAEDKGRRENRLLMLKQLRALFLHVADIALLQ